MWDRKNQVIRGRYLKQFPYEGVVRDSRVKLGGHVQHTVDLIDSIFVLGCERFTILIDESEEFLVDLDLNECYN